MTDKILAQSMDIWLINLKSVNYELLENVKKEFFLK